MNHLDTGSFTLQGLGGTDNGTFVDIGRRDYRYRRGNIFPFHRTVTDYHYLVEQLVVLAHGHGIDIFISHFQGVIVVANV